MAPSDRGYLQGEEDSQYEVSNLLAHDFKFTTFAAEETATSTRRLLQHVPTAAEMIGRTAGCF